ncbi:uncharacterized protein LOC116800128 [Chiroxiphia lanceolata]|uniref:uncharacterized protein LOC116800128 n=1 Tax=Chiroxiphia lanceolata TaxID=296741 RepID=UPI0013CF337B|nr:uncharacterized protein LOC116800128 [Chiroxiphia lanceolata]
MSVRSRWMERVHMGPNRSRGVAAQQGDERGHTQPFARLLKVPQVHPIRGEAEGAEIAGTRPYVSTSLHVRVVWRRPSVHFTGRSWEQLKREEPSRETGCKAELNRTEARGAEQEDAEPWAQEAVGTGGEVMQVSPVEQGVLPPSNRQSKASGTVRVRGDCGGEVGRSYPRKAILSGSISVCPFAFGFFTLHRMCAASEGWSHLPIRFDSLQLSLYGTR